MDIEELFTEKFVSSTLIAVALFYIGLGYFADVIKTSEYNPIRIYEHYQLKREIFNPNGLADSDKNGKISLTEKTIAYEKMGLKYEDDKPTLEQLRECVESYGNQ